MPQIVFPAPGTENAIQYGPIFGGIELNSSNSASFRNLLNYTEDLNNTVWERGNDLIRPATSNYDTLSYYLNDTDTIPPQIVRIAKTDGSTAQVRFNVYNSADQYVFDKDLLIRDNVYRPVRSDIDTFLITTRQTNGYLRQTLTLEKNQFYTFSFYAKRGTATSLYLAVFADAMFPLVAPTSYYDSINDSNYTRVSVEFYHTGITQNNNVTIYLLYPLPQDLPGTVLIYAPQIERGRQVTSYTASVGMSLATANVITRSANSTTILGAISPYPFSSNNLTTPALPIVGYDYVTFDSLRQYVFDTDLLPTTAFQSNVVTNRTFYFPYQPVAPFAANTYVRVNYTHRNVQTQTIYYVNSTNNFSINIAASTLPYIGGTITDAASFSLNQDKVNELNINFNPRTDNSSIITNYFVATYYKPNFRGVKFVTESVDQKNNLVLTTGINEPSTLRLAFLGNLSLVGKLKIPVIESENSITKSYGNLFKTVTPVVDIGIYSNIGTAKVLLLNLLKDLKSVYTTFGLGRTKPPTSGIGALTFQAEHNFSLRGLGKLGSVGRLVDLPEVETRRRTIGKLVENYFQRLIAVPDISLRIYKLALNPVVRQPITERFVPGTTANVVVSPINNNLNYQTFVSTFINKKSFTPAQRLLFSTDAWLGGGSRQLVDTSKTSFDYIQPAGDGIERLLNKINLLNRVNKVEIISDINRFTVGNFTRQLIVSGLYNEDNLYRIGRTEQSFIRETLIQNYVETIDRTNFLNKKLFILQTVPDQRSAAVISRRGVAESVIEVPSIRRIGTVKPVVALGGTTLPSVAKVLVQERLRSVINNYSTAFQLRKYINEGAIGQTLRVVGQNNITYNVAREFIFDTDFSGNSLIPLTANTNANAASVTVTVNRNLQLNSPAVYFDGYDDVVQLSSQFGISALEFTSVGTIEMFVQPVSNQNLQILTSFYDHVKNYGASAATLNGTDIFLNRNLQVCVGKIGVQGNSVTGISTVASITQPEFILAQTVDSLPHTKLSHLAVVFENNNLRIYIDGVQQALTGTTSGFTFNPTLYKMSIGYSSYSTAAEIGKQSSPALSPQQLVDAGITANGFYWYKSAEMTSSVQLFTMFNMADNKPWVRVFSSPWGATATVNQVGQNIPWHGMLLQTTDLVNRQFTYFPTRQLFNTRSDTATSTSGSITGVRVFIGQPGGHGFYTTGQLPCSWGSSSNLLAAGYNGGCGSFPDAMLWGTGSGSAFYNMLSTSTMETWIYWTHVGS